MSSTHVVKVGVFLVFSCVILSACAGTATLNLKYQPSTDTKNLLAFVPPLRVKVLNFADKRTEQQEAILIGGRQAAFGMPMGDVYSDRPIFDIIREAMEAELTRSGHSIVADNEDIILGGEITTFLVGTDVTVLYWDVVGEVTITVKVKTSEDDTPVVLGPYGGKEIERTYVNPSVAIMERVLGASLTQVMNQMNSDKELITALKK
jgi:uncharacterized lipoprotein YajG